MTYKVKHGVPETDVRYGRTKYPFGQMEVGTYFVVPANDPAAKKNCHGTCAVQSSAYSWQKRHGGNFAVRRQGSGAVHIYKVK